MRKKSISKIVSNRVFIFIMVCAMSISIINIKLYVDSTYKSSQGKMHGIASSISSGLDTAKIAEINASGEENEYAREVKEMLSAAKTDTDVEFLYVLGITEDGSAYYLADGEKPTDPADSDVAFFGETVNLEEFGDSISRVLDGDTQVVDAEGGMATGYSPVFGDDGSVIAIVGADEGLDELMAEIRKMSIINIAVAVGASFLFGLLINRFLVKRVHNPLDYLTESAIKMSRGDIDLSITHKSEDEIGELGEAFMQMADSIQEQAEILASIATGDYTMTLPVRSEKDVMNRAINEVVNSNHKMASEIKGAAGQVAAGASQVAQGSQQLASGSTQQAASIEEISASVGETLSETEESAAKAEIAFEDTRKIEELMQKSMESMSRMTDAMKAIDESSRNISKIIKVIDDIAFQTNILALNAAVEASRAGEHGKGFAVVAEEVRNLASKSAEAAKETSLLIESSIKRVSEGNDIALQTNESLQNVVEVTAKSAVTIQEIGQLTKKQKSAMDEINQGIGQVATVVQSNSATSEESAAVSEEMSSQAQMLNSAVSRFKLREDKERF